MKTTSSGVRSEHGLIQVKSLEDHGFDLVKIKEWRTAEAGAGRPSSLEDFYAANGLCFDCGAYGARMIGWSNPTNEIEVKAAVELGVDQLPLYETCRTCNGIGKADRSEWRKL